MMSSFNNDWTIDGHLAPSEDAQSHNRYLYLQAQDDFQDGVDPRECDSTIEQNHYNSGWAYAEWLDNNNN